MTEWHELHSLRERPFDYPHQGLGTPGSVNGLGVALERVQLAAP